MVVRVCLAALALVLNSVCDCALASTKGSAGRSTAQSQGGSETTLDDSNDSNYPTIGVLSQPMILPGASTWNMTYFPASYAKYAAMAGSRVVPVVCDTPKAELKALYKRINGLIVPGTSSAGRGLVLCARRAPHPTTPVPGPSPDKFELVF
jgi:hypothetical protein